MDTASVVPIQKKPVNRGFAGSGNVAMPEKRQQISAACRFSAAYPCLVVLSEKAAGKKKREPLRTPVFCVPLTNHFAW